MSADGSGAPSGRGDELSAEPSEVAGSGPGEAGETVARGDPSGSPRGGQPVWVARTGAVPDPTMLEYTSSVAVDQRLWRQDIAGSRAHLEALVRSGVLTTQEAESIANGLAVVEREFSQGEFEFRDGDEDVHMAIERRLQEVVGPVARKLHAGRSRNDQVATDFRLWIKQAAKSGAGSVLGLVERIEEKARQVGDAVVFEYTHLQRSQPVLLAHHLLAHAWALLRDAGRFRLAHDAADRSPLGAAAGVGTSLVKDTSIAAQALGFAGAFQNSVDAVSDRDFALDFVHACVIAQLHMSRLAEELVLWSSEEFGIVEVGASWATGSSIMPQKKNPDVAELARGRAGKALGSYVSLATMLKGLPLAYNRDLQEDKGATFDAYDLVTSTASALGGMLSSCTFHAERLSQSYASSFTLATDVVELAVERGMAFRDAHAAVASLVRSLAEEGKGLESVDERHLREAGLDAVTAEEIRRLDVRASVASKKGSGMTSPEAVAGQLESLAQERAEVQRWVES